MAYYKIKLSGIYKITHNSGYYYIGMSVDVFSRWQSHYSNFKLNNHSSTAFMRLWNDTDPSEWTFEIVELLSKTKARGETKLKGKKFDGAFRKLLLTMEKDVMGNLDVEFALNKNNKHFKH